MCHDINSVLWTPQPDWAILRTFSEKRSFTNKSILYYKKLTFLVSTSLLFRSNSFAMKCMGAYFKLIGKSFIEKVLSELVQKIAKEKSSTFEVLLFSLFTHCLDWPNQTTTRRKSTKKYEKFARRLCCLFKLYFRIFQEFSTQVCDDDDSTQKSRCWKIPRILASSHWRSHFSSIFLCCNCCSWIFCIVAT